MRSLIGDRDGWAEYETPAGIAKFEESGASIYIIEQCFRTPDGSTIFLWFFDPQNRALEMEVYTNGASEHSNSPSEVTDTDPLEALEERWRSLSQCVQGISGRGRDYEDCLWLKANRHNFMTEALQDLPEAA